MRIGKYTIEMVFVAINRYKVATGYKEVFVATYDCYEEYSKDFKAGIFSFCRYGYMIKDENNTRAKGSKLYYKTVSSALKGVEKINSGNYEDDGKEPVIDISNINEPVKEASESIIQYEEKNDKTLFGVYERAELLALFKTKHAAEVYAALLGYRVEIEELSIYENETDYKVYRCLLGEYDRKLEAIKDVYIAYHIKSMPFKARFNIGRKKSITFCIPIDDDLQFNTDEDMAEYARVQLIDNDPCEPLSDYLNK